MRTPTLLLAAIVACSLGCGKPPATPPQAGNGSTPKPDDTAQPGPADETPAPLSADVIKKLTADLSASDALTRIAAADELGDRGEAAASAVDALAKVLSDDEPMVRAHAARALGKIGKPSMSVLEDLFKATADDDPHVRRAAFSAVKAIKPGTKVGIPLFVKALGDKDQAVVLRALHTLADYGEEVVPVTIDMLADKQTAYWACLVISELGPKAKDAVPALIKTLESDEPETRLEASMALGTIGADAVPAVPALTKLLDEDTELGVRGAAAYTLGVLGPAAADAEASLKKSFEDDDVFLQAVSAWSLARIVPEDEEMKKKATPPMIELLKHDERQVRVMAARALHELKPGPKVMVPAFAEIIKTSKPEVVDDVLEAVAALGPEALPGLTDALGYPEVRGHVAQILGRIGPEAAPAVAALIEAAKDERGEVRREILMALGNIGPEAAAALPLARKSMHDENDEVRRGAVFVLGQLGKAALPALEELRAEIGKHDANNKQGAYFCTICAWAAVRIDPANDECAKQALPLLIGALAEGKPSVRHEAAMTLGLLGPRAKSALADLEKSAKDDDDAEVRAAAAEAIKKIGG